jgi:hypothetical protein
VIGALLLASLLAPPPGAGESFLFRCETGSPRRAVPCRVCLVPEAGESSLVCAEPGAPLHAGFGRYAVRAYAEGLALGENLTLATRAVTATRARTVLLTLVPGGRVAVARPIEVLSLETGVRAAAQPSLESEVPVPSGRAVAFATAAGGAIAAVSRPIDVPTAGDPVAAGFTPATEGTGHVVLRLEYPAGTEDPSRRDARIVLEGPTGGREAGAATNAPGIPHYSVFYDVPAGRWTAEVHSDLWSAVPIPFEVAAGGGVAPAPARLLPRPTLTVELEVDPVLAGDPRRVSLYRCAPGEWTASAPINTDRCPQAGSIRGEDRPVFSRVEARWHVLEIEAGQRRLRRSIDLRAGADLNERVAIEPTLLSGVVRRGRRGVPARLELESLDDPGAAVTAKADPDGKFRAALWPQGAWRARIFPDRLDPADAPVFPVDAPRPGPQSQNFELAPTEVRVLVLDEGTGDPLPGASVAFLSFGTARWREADGSGQVAFSGVAPGMLALHAEAEGYRTRQAEIEVENSGALQSFEIAMRPLERGNAFAALLPSGLPAGSARAFVGSNASGLERERVDCDEAGTCRLAEPPREAEGLVLAHPDGGFTVVSATQALAERRVTLLPSGGILRLRPVRGEATADALLRVSLSIPGATLPPVWLDNLALAIGGLSRTAVFPGARSGFFLSGLPAGPIAVTITAARRDETGSFGPPVEVAGPFLIELPALEIVDLALP